MTISDRDKIKEHYGEVLFEICVELGRKRVKVGDMLRWENGSILKLNKTSGEPADFMVNGKPIACGEVMVLDERFAIRITEILSKELLVEKYKDGLYD